MCYSYLKCRSRNNLSMQILTLQAKSVRRICICLYFGYISTHLSYWICIDLFSVFLVFNFYLHLSSNKCTDCSYSACFRKEWRRDLHLKPCAGYKWSTLLSCTAATSFLHWGSRTVPAYEWSTLRFTTATSDLHWTARDLQLSARRRSWMRNV